jgi:hypothetical protein
MGYFYMTSIRCKNKYIASALESKYQGQGMVFNPVHDGQIVLSGWGGDYCRFLIGHSEKEGENWVTISPTNITGSGITDPDEARKANEYCNVIYGMLKNDPYFDYAVSGVECEYFRTLKDLIEEIKSGFAQNFDGLIVSNTILEECGNPDYFQPFSKTHKWIPKKPEVRDEASTPTQK